MPNAPSTSPAIDNETQPYTTQAIINQILSDAEGKRLSAQEIARKNEEVAKEASEDVKKDVDVYNQKLMSVVGTYDIGALDNGIAGQYEKGGTIVISTSTLQVQDDTRSAIETTMTNTELVVDHENVHKEDKHLASLQIYAGQEAKTSDAASSKTILVMGGKEFTDEGLKEGVAVAATGTQSESGDFQVSAEYVQYKSELEGAIAVASARGITLQKVREAIRKGDISEIDDRAQARQQPRMAA